MKSKIIILIIFVFHRSVFAEIKPNYSFMGNARGVYTLNFSPSGEKILIYGVDGFISIWDYRNGLLNWTYYGGKHKNARAYFFNEEKVFFVSDNELSLVDIPSKRKIFFYRNSEPFNNYDYNEKKKIFSFLNSDNKLYIIDLNKKIAAHSQLKYDKAQVIKSCSKEKIILKTGEDQITDYNPVLNRSNDLFQLNKSEKLIIADDKCRRIIVHYTGKKNEADVHEWRVKWKFRNIDLANFNYRSHVSDCLSTENHLHTI